MGFCIVCGKKTERKSYKYCSNKCQWKYQHQRYIESWQSGTVIKTKNISHHIRRFLIDKYGESCVLCGWSKRNPVTQKVPLEVDHVDGDANNNNEKNLRLICPNCHSLTPSFRNLNKGKGRKWRLIGIENRKSK